MGAISKLFRPASLGDATAELAKAERASVATEAGFHEGTATWPDVLAARGEVAKAEVIYRGAQRKADEQAQASEARQRATDEKRLAALLVSTRPEVVAEAVRPTLDRIVDAALLLHAELRPAVTDAAATQTRDVGELQALAVRLGADVQLPAAMHLCNAIGLVQRHLAHRLGDQRMRFDVARWLLPAGDVSSATLERK